MIKHQIGYFTKEDSKLLWKSEKHILWVEPWGQNGVRIRATMCSAVPEKEWSLIIPPPSKGIINIDDDSAVVKNGLIEARISKFGQITFHNTDDGRLLCAERSVNWLVQHPRSFKYKTNRLFHAELTMQSFMDEKIYGLGQHQHGYLDQKGCVLDLVQTNGEVTIPFMVSNRGYGFIWHNPGIGRVELSKNHTRWIANSTSLIDYVVIGGNNPSDIMERYAEITGFPLQLPEWAAGFWQCKLRYKTQEELLNIAREYKKRNLPISVIVIDFFHWSMMGDYSFDIKHWPDPKGMVEELKKMDIRVMVSIWPTVNVNSKNYEEFKNRGYLIQTKNGYNVTNKITDTYGDENTILTNIDTTNPEARKYLWNLIKKNYFDYGIKTWWLDAIEPETHRFKPFGNFVFYEGDGEEVALLYPMGQQICFYEGMKKEEETEIITLCRSGFLGSQRYGAAIWSGDIKSTFESLQKQVRAGLNIALSGIPWWTTDIGGFEDGNIDSEYFKELIMRWFQYGVFCPLFRLHGYRTDNNGNYTPQITGGANNEVWSFGEKAYEVIRECMNLRERLRPYIMEQMKLAHKKGIPVIRPLFFNFPSDPKTYDIEDEFMFGPDILVAPILNQGDRNRKIYLPSHARWLDPHSSIVFDGGQSILVDAPLERIPVFLKNGKKLPIIGN